MIDYQITQISKNDAKIYIRKYHYSHSCINAPVKCFGLFEKTISEEDGLFHFQEQPYPIGVCIFAVPCSENVRSSVFGKEYKNHVLELHRLHILDCTPKNTESWFVSRCLRMLKVCMPEIWAVISFSDLTEGHTGVIYKALNAYRLGNTGKATFFLDGYGRLRHPRQNGKNISMSEAERMGWKPIVREAKCRFLWLTPSDKRDKKRLLQIVKLNLGEYAKK
jgi:hypothetical protein